MLTEWAVGKRRALTVMGPVGRRIGIGQAEKTACAMPPMPCKMRYSDIPTLPSVTRSATSPNATVEANVAKNMKSTAATVFELSASTISVINEGKQKKHPFQIGNWEIENGNWEMDVGDAKVL